MYTITWDKPNNLCLAYVNGRYAKTNSTTPGVWTGALATANLGGFGNLDNWHGWLAHAGLWGRAWSASEVERLMFRPRRTR